MKAVEKSSRGPGLTLVDKRVRPVGEGDVVLEVAAAGICGTDIHILDDEFPYTPPVTLGHEFSGVVAEVGSAVDPGWLGARVVSEAFYSTCGHCGPCRTGRLNLCSEKLPLGTKLDGGFAARVVAPARNLHRIPDWLDLTEAALAEPLACVCNSLCDPGVVQPGDRVAVVGPGTIGQLAAQVARAAGGTVLLIGTERDAERLALAQSLGFDVARADERDRIEAHGGGLGADVVVECSGAEAGIHLALELTRRMGRYVQIGHAGRDVRIPFDLISYRELIVRAGQGAPPRAWTRAMSVIDSRALDLGVLISEVAPLEDFARVFEDVRAGRGLKHLFAP